MVKPGVKRLVLILMGLFLLSRYTGGKLLFYINERFVWLTLLAAAGFILIGFSYHQRSAHGEHHGDHSHGHLTWAGLFLVVLPIILGVVFPPQPLGAAALGNRDVSVESLSSITAPDQNRVITKPKEKYNVLDWVIEFQSVKDPATFTGQEAELVGFVYRYPGLEDDMFMVSRFIISCCAADAVPVGIIVRWPNADDFPDDAWVVVRGHFEPGTLRGEPAPDPIMVADSVESTEIPKQPYLYIY
jgi:uncharacterized repeat protein (TIGR03943 family)